MEMTKVYLPHVDKTYYVSTCRVHPNPTSIEFTVWEAYSSARNSHSTMSYSNSSGRTLGRVGTRRFDCDLPYEGPNCRRMSILEEHRGAQREVCWDVLEKYFRDANDKASFDSGKLDPVYCEFCVSDENTVDDDAVEV